MSNHYVLGEDEDGNTVDFIEDDGELVTRDNIISWSQKVDIKPDSERKLGPWIKRVLIWLIKQNK